MAKVVARMNGGVSSRIGRTSDGMVMMWCARMKPIRPLNVSRKRLQQLIGRGMIRAQLCQHCAAASLSGSSSFATCVELRLVLAQVGPADLQQLVERRVDHLVVCELLRKVSAPMRKSPLDRGSRSVFSQSR